MKLEDRYMYTVVPRSPIRNIVKGKAIIKATNLLLSREEVEACLKYGAVYRKFYCETNSERVTPSNLDRLHRKDHISESQYNSLISNTDTKAEEDDLLKNGEEGQLSTDENSGDTVPQAPEETEDDENENPEAEEEPAKEETPTVEDESTESSDDKSEPEMVFDTEGDFLKKDDEEQSYIDENENPEAEEEPAKEETPEQPLTQKQVANANNNQRNNGKKGKNKNKQRNQSAENKSQQTE